VNPYPTLSGETLVVPIVGDPIAQVKSPDGRPRVHGRGLSAAESSGWLGPAPGYGGATKQGRAGRGREHGATAARTWGTHDRPPQTSSFALGE
jgi:hypothetical protein